MGPRPNGTWITEATGLMSECGCVVCVAYCLGSPLDIMRRRVLCAGTRKLADTIAGLLCQIELESD